MKPDSPDAEFLAHCPLCNGTILKRLPVPGRWIGLEVFANVKGAVGLHRCRGCGLTFTNPRPSQKLLAAFYSGNTYTCHDDQQTVLPLSRAKLVRDRISHHLPTTAPRTLLDYGCGAGAFLQAVRTLGWEAVGFEPGRRGAETCRRLGLDVTDRLSDLTGHRFSIVTLNHVFEHLRNPTQALSEIRPFMNVCGRLAVEVPNVRSLRARLALPYLSKHFGVDERYRAFPIHLVYYKRDTLRRTLTHAGWDVESIFTLGIGLDEFFVRRPTRPDASQTQNAHPVSRVASAYHKGGLVTYRLRDAFLSLGIGENLFAVAVPGGHVAAESRISADHGAI